MSFPEITTSSLCGYRVCEHDICKTVKEERLSRAKWAKALVKEIECRQEHEPADDYEGHFCPEGYTDKEPCRVCNVIKELLRQAELDESGESVVAEEDGK